MRKEDRPGFHVIVKFSHFSRTLASVKMSKVKGAIWSADMSHVALYSKHGEKLSTTSNSMICL